MKNIVVALFVLVLFAFKQEKKDCWKILVNKKLSSCGYIGQQEDVIITAKPKDKITISYCYKGDEPNWKRSIIIMDEKRRELWRSDFTGNSGKAIIDAKTLQALTSNTAFTIQTVATPMDRSLAASIRVGTVQLCSVHWGR